MLCVFSVVAFHEVRLVCAIWWDGMEESKEENGDCREAAGAAEGVDA